MLPEGNFLANTDVTTGQKSRWNLKHSRIQIGYLTKTEACVWIPSELECSYSFKIATRESWRRGERERKGRWRRESVCAHSCASHEVKASHQTHCRIPDDDNDIQRIMVYVCLFYSYNQQATEDKFLWSYLILLKVAI